MTNGGYSFKNCCKVILGVTLFLGTIGSLHADVLDTWTKNQVSTNLLLADIAYANGRYVAAGYYPGSDTGTILSSDDGLSWTPRLFTTTNSFTAQVYSVAYGAGTYVGVGYSGSIYASTNGINWVSTYAPVPIWNLFGVTFGNGTFVAVGGTQTFSGGTSFSNIITSVDGINWTARKAAPSAQFATNLSAVAYGGGRFVAVGDGGTLLTSPNGSSWTRYTSAGGLNYSQVVYGNGIFIASYGSGTNLIIPANSNPFPPIYSSFQNSGTTVSFGRLAFFNGLFIAAGYSSTLGTNVFLTSTDGTNWLQHSYYYGDTITGLIFDGRQLVAVGDSSNFLFGSVFTSAPLVSLGLSFNGSPQLNLTGAVGLSYRIDYQNQLPSGTGSNWQSLTNFTLTNSPCIWTDTQTSNSQSRFYRAVQLP